MKKINMFLLSGAPSDEELAKLADSIMTSIEGERKKADKKKPKCEHMNEDGTFKNGFDGCVDHMMECQGHDTDSAQRICAYIKNRKYGPGPMKKDAFLTEELEAKVSEKMLKSGEDEGKEVK